MSVPAAPPPILPDASGPPAVSRFEYNLLRLLQFILGQGLLEQAKSLVETQFRPVPPCLSATCVRLVKDTLAKGLIRHLIHSGGWRRDRHLHGSSPVEGRVWERIPLDERALAFSPAPLAFLIWLTAEKPANRESAWDTDPNTLTPADELFFAITLDRIRQIDGMSIILTSKRAFRDNALAWLLHPGDFATTGEPKVPAFEPWMKGLRAVFLECLGPDLARRWIQSERDKATITDWRQMHRLGQTEFATLSAFLAAAESAGRQDLARFVVTALGQLLKLPDIGPEYWTAGLRDHRPARLSERLETERAALALVRQIDTLNQWEQQARSVGYFDEGYAASQLWKSDWETAGGETLSTTARRLLDAIEPLRSA